MFSEEMILVAERIIIIILQMIQYSHHFLVVKLSPLAKYLFRYWQLWSILVLYAPSLLAASRTKG